MQRLLKKPLRLSSRQLFIFKSLVHIVALGYLGIMFYLGFQDELGADPVKTLIHFTGTGAINLLMITLVVSPLAKRLPCADLMRMRRMLGLYTFVYALSHFVAYILFELQLNFSLLGSEIAKRPYITVGFTAFLLLLMMAATSTKGLQRRLGRNWQRLHNTIYLCAVLALLHFTWSLKTAWGDPIFYWILAAFLLYLRKDKWRFLQRKKSR
ncbi:sulfoxide reductase heme-binding subunit YedZ [Alteromonas pelagimontana]|uniref:Protein-methionine-sulfoxide reductase heme-binding subunit MsrQ n=1 Tax=Alteromonas pelagimontana TaxID=1858656 RepID=A0A6M4M9H7_9ALTE|nr:protein-methionine-sulfoxide reductase heme-binding subunit MsrQ [Alteromonas pelagimontana]QJR79438.1 sulfoxide reductase heme-binding subunit YedZ [Alteromonas pelagimontana]